MLKSKGVIVSSKSPLRVAAYCFKHLKKAQVFDTDIPSSVDKILHGEMDVVSYRVLAYLLLGVVRIYSKKVEYLFHDCNEVLIKINKFVINTKDTAHVETLRMSVTIPERFELDAFNLDVVEDAGGGHIAPKEAITLKEVLCKTEGFAQFSQDKFEEFDSGGIDCSVDHHMLEDFCQSHLMNMDFEVFPPNSPINLLGSNDLFHCSNQKEPMNFETGLVLKGIEKEAVNLFGQDEQINEDQTVQEIIRYEDEIHEERSRISQVESMDINMFSEREKEPILSVEVFNESHQVDNEHSMAKETSSSLCQMHQEIVEVLEAKSFQESIEGPQDDKSCQEGCRDHDSTSVAKGSLEELIAMSVEEHDNKGKLEFRGKVSLEDGKLGFRPGESKNLDVTPQSKFQGGSAGRPNQGDTTPESMVISTPVVRERAHFSRKRKIVLDGMLVLPTEVLRKSILDASDLISNRRKFRRTLLSMPRESHISSLPDGFYESLLPCYASELQFLFYKKKMEIPDSLEIVETLGKLDVSESQIIHCPQHVETAPQTPPWCPDSLVVKETQGKLDVSESHSCSPDHIATAPHTPPRCQKFKVRSIEHLDRTEIQYSDNLEPASPHESIDREQSLAKNKVLNLMEEFSVETLNSCEGLEREQCSTKDEDLNLMNEEINSCEAENSELLAGWSERTRKVARYMHKNFLDLRKQRDRDVVNFSQVFGGRVRKECARLFYEILVLRTTSYVDVKQNKAYGDISVWKLPKLDQTFGVDGLSNDISTCSR